MVTRLGIATRPHLVKTSKVRRLHILLIKVYRYFILLLSVCLISAVHLLVRCIRVYVISIRSHSQPVREPERERETIIASMFASAVLSAQLYVYIDILNIQ